MAPRPESLCQQLREHPTLTGVQVANQNISALEIRFLLATSAS